MSSLKNRTVSSFNEAHTLIDEIALLKNSGAIKIIKGSLLTDPMIEVEFKVSATEEDGAFVVY